MGKHAQESYVSSNYLTQASASTSYLTQASASTSYLTQASASTTYLTQDIELTRKNGIYVITNNNYLTCETSTDGITWIQRTMPVNAGWQDIKYANDVFLAVTNNQSQTAATSTNGITWTQRTLPANAGTSGWSITVYNQTPTVFVGVARGTTVGATSTDGITWTQTTAISANWVNIASPPKDILAGANAVAIAGGFTQTAARLSGTTWTQTTLPIASNWSKVIYGQTAGFIAISTFGTHQIAATSTNGLTWVRRTLPTTDPFFAGTYGNGRYVIFPNSDSNFCLTSTDGITWIQISTPQAAISDVIFANNKFIGISSFSNSNPIVSSNGLEWVKNSQTTTRECVRIAYGEQQASTQKYNLTDLINSLLDDTF